MTSARLDDVLSTLRQAIEAEEGALIVKGRLLPERELTAVLGASRRSIRNALERLEEEGLVFRRQGQGTFIRPASSPNRTIETIVNRTNPSEIMEVRREIEPAIARLAALRATPADLEMMRRLIRRGITATSADALDRWDRAFHAKIARCVRNDLFYRMFEMIDAVRAETSWVRFRENSYAESNREHLAAAHFAIVDAIESRDPAQAEAAMRNHLATIAAMVG
ncbi:FadR/GntR family transcriptional regulator [Paraburkholderia sp. EG285A]|uniref:FadR/GntR family transcriptional regulator n=1 Tax=Paraburkholderia sp. EG285A TaxID=3237009 RepID=UPI0034D27078